MHGVNICNYILYTMECSKFVLCIVCNNAENNCNVLIILVDPSTAKKETIIALTCYDTNIICN